MKAYERMKALIDAECLFCVPTFIREYLTKRALEKVKQEHPDLYEVFCNEEKPSEEETEKMKIFVNDALNLRVKQHFERRQGK